MTERAGTDPNSMRKALGCFATGITVVTTTTREGTPIGLTMNSFSSVSLEPPLILFSLDKGSEGLEDFKAAKHFGINILSDEQEELSARFAMSDDKSIRKDEFMVWESGAPILKDMIANLDCVPEQQIEGGDHIIFLCRVLETGSSIGGDPLLYFRSRYFTVEPVVG